MEIGHGVSVFAEALANLIVGVSEGNRGAFRFCKGWGIEERQNAGAVKRMV